MNLIMDRVVVSSDVVLPYVESGNPGGIPVLFLHGITDSWRSFEPVLPSLPPDIRAISLTQRGHGEASRPVNGYDWLALSGDVRAVLDNLGIDRAVIVGHSFGSQVAMHFAARYPDRVLGLVLIGAFFPAPGLPSLRELWDEVFSTIADPIDPALTWEFQASTVARPVAPGLLEMAAAESLKVPAHVWKSAFVPLLTMDLRDRLYRIQSAVRLIWGDQDSMSKCSDQAAILAGVPSAELTTYYGAGHAVHWEEPERVAGEIAEFALAAVSPR